MSYFERNPKAPPLRLSAKHLRILDTVVRLSSASTDQINKALYKGTSRTTTANILWQLFNHGYLDRIPFRDKTFGSPQVVHRATGKSSKLLRKRLMAGKLIIPSSLSYTRANEPLRHLLRANDVIVEALALVRVVSNIAVEFESEPYLRRDPLVIGDGANQIVIIPDAWIRIRKIRAHDVGEAVLLIELHTGSQWKVQIQDKVKAYVRMDGSDEYQRRFGTDRRLVVFVTPENDPGMVAEVKGFITDCLRRLLREDCIDLFAVARYQNDFFFASGLLPSTWRENDS